MYRMNELIQKYKYITYVIFTLIILLFYFNTLFYGYINDDFILVNIDSISEIFYSPFPEHVRPIWYLSYFLTNYFFQSAFFDHLINLILFILSSFLAFKVSILFLKNYLIAFYVTVFWIILPWNCFPVTWISQRNDLLLFIFSFSSLLLLYKQKYITSIFLLFLGVFSKVTIVFLPIFYIYKSIKDQKYKFSIIITFTFLLYFIIQIIALRINHKEQVHLQDLSIFILIANYIFHWFESLFTFFIPIPFFINIYHFVIYIIGVILLLINIFFIKKNNMEDNVIETNYNFKDLIFIFLLLSIPTMITPELRIIGLESLFILILFGIFIKVKMVKINLLSYISIILITGAFITSIESTKIHFKTNFYNPKQKIWLNRCYYPNNYYEKKREVLIKIYKKIFNK